MASTSKAYCNCPPPPLNPLLPLINSFSSFSYSMLILFLFFSQRTPLHRSARWGRLEVCRLLVESKADVAATDMCFSPPPSHHLSLTICLAAVAELHSTWPSTTTKPTLLHTCTASARRNDALTRAAAAAIRNKSSSCVTLVRVAAAVRGVSCKEIQPKVVSDLCNILHFFSYQHSSIQFSIFRGPLVKAG
jgi:hypothetical protein